MTEFKKFPSIENYYHEKFLQIARETLEGYDDFIVQEKVHGANFAFYVSDGEVTCAKRTSFLGEDDKFYNFQKVLEENKEKITYLSELYTLVGEDIIVFGELFGGGVQKEVFYSDDKIFIAFDIYVVKERTFIAYDKVRQLFQFSNLYYVPELFRGTLDECLLFNAEIDSVVAHRIAGKEVKDNLMEGVVIRPNNDFRMQNGSRLIFKKKNESFLEKKKIAKPKVVDLRDYSEYDVYLTKARTDSVISKYGELSEKKQLPEYSGYVVQDIIEDATKDEVEIGKEAKKYIFSKTIKFLLTKYF